MFHKKLIRKFTQLVVGYAHARILLRIQIENLILLKLVRPRPLSSHPSLTPCNQVLKKFRICDILHFYNFAWERPLFTRMRSHANPATWPSLPNISPQVGLISNHTKIFESWLRQGENGHIPARVLPIDETKNVWLLSLPRPLPLLGISSLKSVPKLDQYQNSSFFLIPYTVKDWGKSRLSTGTTWK